MPIKKKKILTVSDAFDYLDDDPLIMIRTKAEIRESGFSGKGAAFTALAGEIFSAYIHGRSKKLRHIPDENCLVSLFAPYYIFRKTEEIRVAMFCPDEKGGEDRILIRLLTGGDSYTSDPGVKNLAWHILHAEYYVCGIAICHNHPGFPAAFSREDFFFTERVIEMLDSMGISFYGHIIVGDNSYAFLK